MGARFVRTGKWSIHRVRLSVFYRSSRRPAGCAPAMAAGDGAASTCCAPARFPVTISLPTRRRLDRQGVGACEPSGPLCAKMEIPDFLAPPNFGMGNRSRCRFGFCDIVYLLLRPSLYDFDRNMYRIYALLPSRATNANP